MALRQEYIQELLKEIESEKELSEKKLNLLKKDLAVKYGEKRIPTNIELLTHLDKEGRAKVKDKLFTKPVRTISGVAPVAIMTKPIACAHGKCTFCPGGPGSAYGDVPQSYTGHEPATMRAIRNRYDAYLQVMNRLQQYVLLGQDCTKVELIVMGGTFCSMPQDYQEDFVWGAMKAMNDFSDLFYVENELDFEKFKDVLELPGDKDDELRRQKIHAKLLDIKKNREPSLLEEQKRNEASAIRCVALCIETKPDWGKLSHGNELLKLGCTRIELGLQSAYDDVLHYVNRGHTIADSKESMQILRDLGFKISVHWMPGLPLTDEKRDLEGFKQLWDDPEYRPDMLKIYPCMVAPGTPLYIQYKRGEFTPLNTEEAAVMVTKMKKMIPEYCRLQRVNRDVPTKMWEDGVGITNLRQHMHQKLKVECKCIRCREPKGKTINHEKVEVKVDEFEASGGMEFFISAVDESQDALVGFCRLRFPKESLREEITADSALIRELHVYGNATAIGEVGNVQHRGYGKKLLAQAEEIAQQQGKRKMVIISGVGVRSYYRKLGYVLEGPYMVKVLS